MKKNKVVFLAVGSRGDINPSCALALELIRRNYDVCIATHSNFKSFVTEKGIDYAPIAGNYQNILNSEVGLNLLEGKGKLRLISDELFYEQLTDAYKACLDSSAIVVFPLSLFGYHIAEKLQVPCICSSYVPLTPTKDFPFLKFGNNRSFLPYLNYFSYSIVNFLSWQADKKVINKFRQQVLNLPPIPFLGASYRKDAPPNFSVDEIPLLYQFSSHIIPYPSDWKRPNIHITGNWFLKEEYQPPLELDNFVNCGEQPIYIGFGSMTMKNPQKIAAILVEAIDKTKQKAVISSGWSDLKNFVDYQDSNIFISSDYIPFDWLFPKMKLLIHHGGSGTIALGLKSGTPQILIPFFADQPAWAEKLHNLEVSPKPIPFKKLSSHNLIEAIETTINSHSIHQKAKKISELLKQENGVKVAANLTEQIIKNFTKEK